MQRMMCSVDIGDTGNVDIIICPNRDRNTNTAERNYVELTLEEQEERERKAFIRSLRRTTKIVQDNFTCKAYVVTETFPAGISDAYRKKLHDQRIERLCYHCNVKRIVLKYVTAWGHADSMNDEFSNGDDSHGWGHRYGDDSDSLHPHTLVPENICYKELLRIFDDGIGNVDIQRADELSNHLTDPKQILERTVKYFYKNYCELTDKDKIIVGIRRVHCSKNLINEKPPKVKVDGDVRPNEFDIAAEKDNADGDIVIIGEPTEIAHDIIKAYNNGFGEFEKLDKAVKKHITGIYLDRYQYESHWHIAQNEYGTFIHLSATKIGSKIDVQKKPMQEEKIIIDKPKSKLEQALDDMIVSPLLRLKDVLVKKGGIIKDRLGEYRVKVNISHELVNPTWKEFNRAMGLPSFDSPNSIQRKAFEDRFLSLVK